MRLHKTVGASPYVRVRPNTPFRQKMRCQRHPDIYEVVAC
jgi:hypothetical protein